MKKLIVLIVLLACLSIPAQSQAAPSPECLDLAKSNLIEIISATDLNSEQLAWQPLVDQGCINSNPAGKQFLDGDERAECGPLLEDGSQVLRPFNQKIKRFFQRVSLNKKIFLKNQKKINKKIKKSNSKAKKKRLKKTRSRLIRNYRLNAKKIRNQNADLINTSAANFLLISGDLRARDCLVSNTWLYINRFSWQTLVLV